MTESTDESDCVSAMEGTVECCVQSGGGVVAVEYTRQIKQTVGFGDGGVWLRVRSRTRQSSWEELEMLPTRVVGAFVVAFPSVPGDVLEFCFRNSSGELDTNRGCFYSVFTDPSRSADTSSTASVSSSSALSRSSSESLSSADCLECDWEVIGREASDGSAIPHKEESEDAVIHATPPECAAHIRRPSHGKSGLVSRIFRFGW